MELIMRLQLMFRKAAALSLLLVMFLCIQSTVVAQDFADSIRRAYQIPEMGYAVVSADSVLAIRQLGYRKINTSLNALPADRFRIGSNTKAVTGFVAALLVKQGRISWNTRFFDLFPEMKANSRKEYQRLTLLDLLSFRARFIKYTYTDSIPYKNQFTGSGEQQRYQFAKWFLQQRPVPAGDRIIFSNLGFVAAAMMLEKASGKSYKQLVTDLGSALDIDFRFGQPNAQDSLQVWGHNASLLPEPPADNYKLEWLLAAGNINLTLTGYAKFIQLQLKGLNGSAPMLTKDEFHFLHYGRPQFAVGWFWEADEKKQLFSWNVGNPGTFLSKVYVYPGRNRAFIFFANIQSDEADRGLDVLYDWLKNKYGI